MTCGILAGCLGSNCYWVTLHTSPPCPATSSPVWQHSCYTGCWITQVTGSVALHFVFNNIYKLGAADEGMMPTNLTFIRYHIAFSKFYSFQHRFTKRSKFTRNNFIQSGGMVLSILFKILFWNLPCKLVIMYWDWPLVIICLVWFSSSPAGGHVCVIRCNM